MNRFGLKWKIAAWCAALLLITQSGGLLLFGTIGHSSALADARAELQTGNRVFDRMLVDRTAQLTQAARVLSADYGFREALLSGDRDTITSALSNHGGRISADLMLLLALDESVMASSPFDPGRMPERLHQLIEHARNSPTRNGGGFAVVSGQLYQVVVVPVMAPVPVAWVVMGFGVDQRLMSELKGVTGLEVSFVRRAADQQGWKLVSSTLNEPLQSQMVQQLPQASLSEDAGTLTLAGHDYASRLHAIDAGGQEGVGAVLQLSLDRALEPWERLFREWSGLSVLGMLGALAASAFMGRSIASPVIRLADFARKVEAGEYAAPPVVARGDEIGQLADAFTHMTGAIASREARISELAYYDALTGLPNRTYFAERLDEYIRAADTATVAIVSLDIDRFKMVNDALGHDLGDLLLKEVARRLREALRDVRDQVARLGGDEFAVMLPDADVRQAFGVAQRIADALNQPMNIEGQMVDVSASMGVSAYPEQGGSARDLMRHADVAMYLAKRHNSVVEIYDPQHENRNVERLSLLSELRNAVERDELVLYYQPKVSAVPDPVHHVEALVRWIHPTRGFIPPFEFIPFAEQTGYIKAITLWVMNAAVKQCGLWLRQGLEVNVSLNISARDLLNPDLPALFADMLRRHACPARLITLEITESAVLDDPLRALANLQVLRDTGCEMSIDDYGTGYSSLSYLRQMPVSEMKIDRSFVMHLLENPNDEIIVRSTIELAHNMGLKVTAEGVETEEVLKRLGELGCDLAQGYLISKPIPADALERWFRESRWAGQGDTAAPGAVRPDREAALADAE